ICLGDAVPASYLDETSSLLDAPSVRVLDEHLTVRVGGEQLLERRDRLLGSMRALGRSDGTAHGARSHIGRDVVQLAPGFEVVLDRRLGVPACSVPPLRAAVGT